jgi:hypothetical protein
MRNFVIIILVAAAAHAAVAQVDIEHRRTLSVQTGFAINDSEEKLGGFGLYWFNENDFPWPGTALRVIFAGLYLDGELSYFLPANTNTAVGAGLGGGVFVDNIVPYRQGERLATQEFYGDNANARLFINHELTQIPVGELGALPVNLRGTYIVSGSFYRPTSDTRNFTVPPDFLTQTLLAEFRIGGIEPGLTARQGLELYMAAEANYRTGFDAFGPRGSEFPAHSKYQRLFGSLAGKIPVDATTVYLRVGGGLGEDLDELSAWKLGGNLAGAEPYTYTLHGYYTREFFADDFGIVNLAISQQLTERHNIAVHLYGDYAAVKVLDVVTGSADEWHSVFGVGAGVSFRTFWDVEMLVSYGYGINAVRNGDRGGHEIGLALEKKF